MKPGQHSGRWAPRLVMSGKPIEGSHKKRRTLVRAACLSTATFLLVVGCHKEDPCQKKTSLFGVSSAHAKGASGGGRGGGGARAASSRSSSKSGVGARPFTPSSGGGRGSSSPCAK